MLKIANKNTKLQVQIQIKQKPQNIILLKAKVVTPKNKKSNEIKINFVILQKNQAMRYLFITSLLFLHHVYDQQNKIKLEPVPLLNVINIQELKDEPSVFLKNIEVHEPGIVKSKEQKMLEKRKSEKDFVPYEKTQKTMVNEPIVEGTYPGNTTGSGVPLDNHIAISKGGKIVAVQNSNFGVYNTQGQQLQQKSLSSLSQNLGFNNTKYDPRIIYDPIHDRFIIVFLNGSSASSSRVIVGFSASNDPAGNWYMYALIGNLKDNQIVTDDVWTDYPAIGISTEELFITGNLFTNGGDFRGSGIWQIPLSEGYSGTALNPVVYVTTYFSLFPVTGATQPYGPDMYFIRNNIGNGGQVHVHYLTNSIANGGVLNNPVTLPTALNYTMPPDAPQKGTSLQLSTNDNRIQSAYFENNVIVYASNTGLNGRSAVYYGMIYLNPLGLNFAFADAIYIADFQYYIAYPSVVYAGCGSSNGNNSLVFVDYSSHNNRPGIGAYAVNEYGDHSNMVIAFEGTGQIGFGTNSPYRWGDYSGGALRQDGSNEIWCYGVVGSSAGVNTGRLAQFSTDLCLTTSNTQNQLKQNNLHVAPVPFYDELQITFSLEKTCEVEVYLLDINGRMIKNLVSDKLYAGSAKFIMSLNELPKGTYIIQVQKDNDILGSKKVVKEYIKNHNNNKGCKKSQPSLLKKRLVA